MCQRTQNRLSLEGVSSTSEHFAWLVQVHLLSCGSGPYMSRPKSFQQTEAPRTKCNSSSQVHMRLQIMFNPKGMMFNSMTGMSLHVCTQAQPKRCLQQRRHARNNVLSRVTQVLLQRQKPATVKNAPNQQKSNFSLQTR